MSVKRVRYSPIKGFFNSNGILATDAFDDTQSHAIYMIFDNCKDLNRNDVIHLELHEHYDDAGSKASDCVDDIVGYPDKIRLWIHIHDRFLKTLSLKEVLEINAFVKSDARLLFHSPSGTAFDTLLCCNCLEHPIWYDHGIDCTFEDLLNDANRIGQSPSALTTSVVWSLMQKMFVLRRIALDLLARLV